MAEKAKILCVDDEPAVLEGLGLHLRRRFQVLTAPGGAAGLEILGRGENVAVVISDMRMPGMDGAAFLKAARQVAPDAARILLTGHADLDAAISAVNEGQIFRFLSKPCPPATLLATAEAAEAQHRLVTAEKVLLEQTLSGSIKILSDVLALANPLAFGRGARIKQLVGELSDKLEIRERWQVELAATLSQLGSIVLPSDLTSKLHHGQALSPAEETMAARVPEVTNQLLGNIPRLESVRAIVAAVGKAPKAIDPATASPEEQLIARGAQLLRMAIDFDGLEAQGKAGPEVVELLRARAIVYGAETVAALAAARGGAVNRASVREIPLSALAAGMIFVEDVKLANGTLLVARGSEVTPSLLARVRNFGAGAVREPLRVTVGKSSA